jgi:hypothetical protein
MDHAVPLAGLEAAGADANAPERDLLPGRDIPGACKRRLEREDEAQRAAGAARRGGHRQRGTRGEVERLVGEVLGKTNRLRRIEGGRRGGSAQSGAPFAVAVLRQSGSVTPAASV